jgi:hypothetical protein
MKQTILIVFAAVLILFGGWWVITDISVDNKEVRLTNQINAKIEDNKSHYTKMWEILTQQAGVAKEYEKAFKEIYPELIAGRYNNGNGQMMQWIQEHNPEFDSSMYRKLMISIEAQRESFHTTQRQLIDLGRQHDNLISTWPSKWFTDATHIDLPIVINSQAARAFETEREVPMSLFGSEKTEK